MHPERACTIGSTRYFGRIVHDTEREAVSSAPGAGSAAQGSAHVTGPPSPVLYWMHREHRAHDNWALLHALHEADRLNAPCAVVYALAPAFLGAGARQFGFLLRGLEETAATLAGFGIPFILLRQSPETAIPEYARAVNAALIVTDFDTLRLKRHWLQRVREAAPCPVTEVDGRNVVPCLAVSGKREYAARTLRPKIHRLLDEFLDDFPAPHAPAAPWPFGVPATDWNVLRHAACADAAVPEVPPPFGPAPGEEAALHTLRTFLAQRLPLYAQRNDPNADALSRLSPYLHFGMLSAQRAVLETLAHARSGEGSRIPAEAREAFLEELVVRRELADNFCLHTPQYDSVEAFPDWARATLDKHRKDPRPYAYDLPALEDARTHDPLWNAAQTQMRRTGTMHGYLRMYWAKKILEWSATPEEAMRHAVFLNDRYFLDGRDANGYTGIAWAMGGVHDRPWQERAIFGTVRYMNYAGAGRKFDVPRYVRRMQETESVMRMQGLF